MPRVPVLGGPSVLPGQPYQQTSPLQVAPDYTEARRWQAVGQVAQALGGAGEALLAKQKAEDEKARKEADALAEAEGHLEYDKRAQALEAEFRKVRGLAASEARTDVLDGLAKSRREVAETLKSPAARARFLTRSAESEVAYRRQVEAHVGKEFDAAREATVKGRMAQALGQAEAGVPDFDSWRTLTRGVEADIRANARSREEADAQVAAFHADSGAALVSGLVAQGRVDEAAKYVEANRAALAGRYVDAKALVDAKAKEGRHAAKVDAAAEEKVQRQQYLERQGERLVQQSLSGRGYVDAAALDTLRQQVPEADRKELEPILSRLEASNAEKRKRELATLRNVLAAFFLRGSTVDPRAAKRAEELLSDPVDGDPSFLEGLEKAQRTEADRRRREAGQDAREKKKVDLEQSREDREALNAYANLAPQELRDTEPAVFAAQHGYAVSSDGLNVMGKTRKAGTKEADTVEAREREAFRKRAQGMADSFYPGKKAKRTPEEQKAVAQSVGEMVKAYDAKVEANGGKPLSEVDKKAIETVALEEKVKGGIDVPLLGHRGGQRVPRAALGLPALPLLEPTPATRIPSAGARKSGAGAPAARKPQRFKFPDGSTSVVPPEEWELAVRKGGYPVPEGMK